MEKKYIDFFSSLQKTYKDTPHYPICKDIQKRYYLEIYSYSFCYLSVSNFGHSISFATFGLTYIEQANISYINSISKYVERSLVGLSNIDNVLLYNNITLVCYLLPSQICNDIIGVIQIN